MEDILAARYTGERNPESHIQITLMDFCQGVLVERASLGSPAGYLSQVLQPWVPTGESKP